MAADFYLGILMVGDISFFITRKINNIRYLYVCTTPTWKKLILMLMEVHVVEGDDIIQQEFYF